MSTFEIRGELSGRLGVSRFTFLDNFYDPDHFVGLHRRIYCGCELLERQGDLTRYVLVVGFLGLRWTSQTTVNFHPPDTISVHAEGPAGLDTQTFWQILEVEEGIEVTCRYSIRVPSIYRPIAPLIRWRYEKQNRGLWWEDVPALTRIEKLKQMGYVDSFPSPLPESAQSLRRSDSKAQELPTSLAGMQ